jgi:hypothetical protein
MNLVRLQQAEEAFLHRYPGGFDNPVIMAIRKKRHNVDKMIAFTRQNFLKRNFEFPDHIVQNMQKVVSQSSVISRFEKPGFRDFTDSLLPEERGRLSHGLDELLHGNEQAGFDIILGLLKSRKLARWSLMTICQAYFHPQRDILVKPNTTRGVIQYFELTNLHYKPGPSWDFYDAYRAAIHEMKSKVDGSLSPTNVAFTWFLLLSFHGRVLQAGE